MATMKVTKSTMHRRVGDMTFYVRNGNMVVRARHNSSRTPKPTLSRMETRMRWKNCINLWRAFPPDEQPAFEGRRPGVSDYNLFLSHAMQTEPVYLTQQLADNGAAVLTSVAVSCGTLPEIGVTNDGTAPATDIALGSLTIGEGTTLGDLATAVVRNNAAFGFGDELLCYVGWQREDAARRVPVVAMECVRVLLDGSDEGLLWQGSASRQGFVSRGGVLAAAGMDAGGVAWVHIRTVGIRTRRSTQRMVVDNPLVSAYCSAEAFEAACRSYGGAQEPPFITPNQNQ